MTSLVEESTNLLLILREAPHKPKNPKNYNQSTAPAIIRTTHAEPR